MIYQSGGQLIKARPFWLTLGTWHINKYTYIHKGEAGKVSNNRYFEGWPTLNQESDVYLSIQLINQSILFCQRVHRDKDMSYKNINYKS